MPNITTSTRRPARAAWRTLMRPVVGPGGMVDIKPWPPSQGRKPGRSAPGFGTLSTREGLAPTPRTYEADRALRRAMPSMDDSPASRTPGPRPAGARCAGVVRGRYLVDPASSHMLVSKIKPCMCKYELIQTVKLRMAH